MFLARKILYKFYDKHFHGNNAYRDGLRFPLSTSSWKAQKTYHLNIFLSRWNSRKEAQISSACTSLNLSEVFELSVLVNWHCATPLSSFSNYPKAVTTNASGGCKIRGDRKTARKAYRVKLWPKSRLAAVSSRLGLRRVVSWDTTTEIFGNFVRRGKPSRGTSKLMNIMKIREREENEPKAERGEERGEFSN